jgi:hypothetical protein
MYVNDSGWVMQRVVAGSFDDWMVAVRGTLEAAEPVCPKCGAAWDWEYAQGEEWFDADEGYSVSVSCVNNDGMDELPCDYYAEFEVIVRRLVSFGGLVSS